MSDPRGPTVPRRRGRPPKQVWTLVNGEPTTRSWREMCNKVSRFQPTPEEFPGQLWERPSYWDAVVEKAREVLTHPMTPRVFAAALRCAGIRLSFANIVAAGERRAWWWEPRTGKWHPIRRPGP